MTLKNCYYLFVLAAFSTPAFAQKVMEGNFNDWGYGPSSVYGNFPIKNTIETPYYKIEDKGKGFIKVSHINPSGIVTHTTSVHFINNFLSAIEETNQWGDTNEYLTFKADGKNEFMVSDLYEGSNFYLPCKYARYTYTDELLSKTEYYSFNDKLMNNKNGVAAVWYIRYTDSIRFGEQKERAFFDLNNQPVISKATDYHLIKFEFDDNNNKIQELYLGINNEPVMVQRSHVAKTRYYYNKDGQMIKLEYYNTEGKIAQNGSGFAIVKFLYSRGYDSVIARFDAAGNSVRSAATGDSIAILKSEYDSRGNLIKESCYDAQGNPISSHAGVHEIVRTWSANNTLITISNFDDFELPSADRDGISTTRYLRDKSGRLLQTADYGINGAPVKNYTDEVFMIKYKYDELGRTTNTSFWKDSITPMPRWSGNYQQSTAYDQQGQVAEFSSLDINGKPMTGKDGTSKCKLIRRPDSRLGERQYFAEDSPALKKRGVTNNYSSIKYGYDENGRINELTFFGPDNQPVNAVVDLDHPFNAQRIIFTYKFSRIITQTFYEIGNNDPVETLDCLTHDYISVSGVSTGRKNSY